MKKIIKFILNKIGIHRKTEVDYYRSRGVRIGENTKLYSVSIDGCFQHLISIGDNCVITYSSIIAHDASTQSFLGFSKVGCVNIRNNVFIGWGSIILGNVTIEDNVIVGAGSVVTKNIPSNSVVAGNPLRFICTYDEYLEHNKKRFSSPCTHVCDTIFFEMTEKQKDLQRLGLKDGWGYAK